MLSFFVCKVKRISQNNGIFYNILFSNAVNTLSRLHLFIIIKLSALFD
mgnify:CR=1 FL=1